MGVFTIKLNTKAKIEKAFKKSKFSYETIGF